MSNVITNGEYLDIFGIHRGADIESEIREIEEVIGRFLSGKMNPEKFLSFRSKYGIYGVRHYPEGMHMVRLKIPMGIIKSFQLRAVADMIEKYVGSGVAHITTRQDIQLHYIKLENIPSLFRDMAKVGLTSIEACGNTVRNITASPFTGINKNEVFDVLPYAMYMTRYFLRHPLASTLPRKFKMAWSESTEDWAMVKINDLGFVADKKVINGEEVRGFRVYVGGGLGIIPMPAYLLSDFVPYYDVYYLSEAIIRIFHREGERKTRSKARLKFLIAKLGIDKFREKVFEEFNNVKKHKNILKDLEDYLKNFPHPAPTSNGRYGGEEVKNVSVDEVMKYEGYKNTVEYSKWISNDVIEQKQEGYFAIIVRIPLGNLKPNDLRFLANISEKYGAGYVITTQRQDIILPWIRSEFLPTVFYELRNGNFISDSPISYITSCPGAYSCKIAITYSYNLVEAISKKVKDLKDIRINISGCPNSCGHHHLGDIGFSGGAIANDDGVIPHYFMYLGGYPYEESAVLGNAIAKIPSINVPDVVDKILSIYNQEKLDNESFRDFINRVGLDRIKREIAEFTKIYKKVDKPEMYRDWGQDRDFQIEAAKRGECAGSLLDIISISLFEAQRELYEAEEYLENEDYGTVIQKSFKAVVNSIRSLLYLDGLEIEDEMEILSKYRENIVPKNILPSKFNNIGDEAKIWPTLISTINMEKAEEILKFASKFVKIVDKSFLRLTPELKIEQLNKDEEGKSSYVE